MHDGRAGRLGGFNGEDRGQDLVAHRDELQRRGGRFLVFRHDRGHAVPDVADHGAEHAEVVRRGLGETLPRLVYSKVRAVAVGHDGNHARQRFGRGRVDVQDPRVRVRAAEHRQDAASRLHPVLHVRLHAGNELRAVDAPLVLADDAQVVAELLRARGA